MGKIILIVGVVVFAAAAFYLVIQRKEASSQSASKIVIPKVSLSPDLGLSASLSLAQFVESQAEPGQVNFVFSPLSLKLALGMLREGLAGESLAELSRVAPDLTLANTSALVKVFEDLGSGPTRVIQGNQIFYHRELTLVPQFTQSMRVNLAVDPKAVDFKSDASKITQEVNSWISSVTQGLIPELLQENDLNFSTRLVLLNAVYFKGLWKKVFDLQDTLALEFNNFDGTKSVVQMMGGKKPLTLFEGPGFDLLTLPFEGDKLSLKLVLPRVEELPLSENLLTQALNELFNDGINTELFVRLPRFEVRTRNKMNSVFERIGVKQIFDPGVADLTNLASHLPGEGGLFVGPIIHEAVVKVDEQGAEAAAATAMALMGAGMAKKTFVFDRPFFFFITLNDQEKGRKEILFSGAIQKL